MNKEQTFISNLIMLRKKLRIRLAMVSVLVFLVIGSVMGQNYALKSSSISNGSQKASSSSYSLTPSLGQPLSGNASSSGYQLTAGFLPTAIPRQAELTLQSSMNITPSEVAPGGTTSLTFTLTNSGAVGIFTSISAEVYLSVNNVFEPEDIRLDTFGIVTDLAAGETLSYPQGSNTKNITIPETTSVGSYNLFVVLYTVDPIDEINSDNAFSRPLTVSNVVSGDTQAPTVSLQTSVFDPSQPIRAEIVDNISTVQSASLSYRPISGTDFTTVALEAGSGNTFSVMPEDSWADELGMEGFIIAEDASGNETESPQTFYLYRAVADNESIPFDAGSFNGKAATYKMFSVPYNLDNSRFEDIFITLGAYDVDVWRIFHYANGDYQELQSGLANSIVLGNGYWFNTTNKDFNIEVGSGTVDNVTQDDPFTKNFQQGWNQIGNPYPFAISWADIQSANPDRGLGSLFTYGNGSYQNTGTLAPWEGAFVFCETAGSVSFPLSSKASSRKGVTKDGFDWKLDLQLTLEGQKHTSSVGMHRLANLSKDRLDEIAVPRFISYLEMTSHHPEYFAPKFIHDYVPLMDHHEWTFDLVSDQKSGNAVLTWDRKVLSAMEGKCFLLNMETLEVIDMTLKSSYDFTWENGKQFRIVYAKDGQFTSALNKVGHPYPNPFRKDISLPVIVQDKDQVLEVSIFDVSGAKVLQQSISFSEGGLHEFTWGGKDIKGMEVREGVYFIKLEIPGNNKMIRVIKQ